jgi:hypothetical protein
VQTNFTSAKGFVLEDETPVRSRLNRTISSADAHVGDTVDFEVLDDITVNGTLVIPKGGLAFATVTEVQAMRRMARGGKLDINSDYVKLVSSDKAPLRAVKDVKGGGHTGAMLGGMVATGILFFPAAPFFLFMHGKVITIPKGTEVTAYVNGDMRLDIARFQPAAPAGEPAQVAAISPSGNMGVSAKLQLESDPPGADIEADIEVDGSFVGHTFRCSGHRGRAHRHRQEVGVQGPGADAEGEQRQLCASQCGTGKGGDPVTFAAHGLAARFARLDSRERPSPQWLPGEARRTEYLHFFSESA